MTDTNTPLDTGFSRKKRGDMISAEDHPLINSYFKAKEVKRTLRSKYRDLPPLHPEVDLSHVSTFQLLRYRTLILSLLTPDSPNTHPFCLICGYDTDAKALQACAYQLGDHPDHPDSPDYVGPTAKSFGQRRFAYYDYIILHPHQYFLQCANCEQIQRSTNPKYHHLRPHHKAARYSRRNLLLALSLDPSSPLSLSAAQVITIRDIEGAYPRLGYPEHEDNAPHIIRNRDLDRIAPYLTPHDPVNLSQSEKDALIDSLPPIQ